MRGAVLYELGMDFVKKRVIRRHYGISRSVIFDNRFHEESRKYEDYDGSVLCRGVMDWYARMVPSASLL